MAEPEGVDRPGGQLPFQDGQFVRRKDNHEVAFEVGSVSLSGTDWKVYRADSVLAFYQWARDLELVPDQPDGLDVHSYELPDATSAAERILAYVASFGDGLYDVADGNPLYGRDLEAVAKASAAYARVLSALEEARAEIERQSRQLQSLARRLAVRFASETELRDLLSRIWLYTNWRYVTGQLETQHKELCADVIDTAGEPDDEPIERWWRNESEAGRPAAQEAPDPSEPSPEWLSGWESALAEVQDWAQQQAERAEKEGDKPGGDAYWWCSTFAAVAFKDPTAPGKLAGRSELQAAARGAGEPPAPRVWRDPLGEEWIELPDGFMQQGETISARSKVEQLFGPLTEVVEP